LAYALMYIGDALIKLGRLGEGKNVLAEVARTIETLDERYNETQLHVLQGDLLKAESDTTAAEHHYRLALACAERQSAKTFELRAATSLARLWRDQGKRVEARGLLSPIYG
jgi:hypothetical protein